MVVNGSKLGGAGSYDDVYKMFVDSAIGDGSVKAERTLQTPKRCELDQKRMIISKRYEVGANEIRSFASSSIQ